MENRLFDSVLFCPPFFYNTKYKKQNSYPITEFFIFIFRKVKKLTTKACFFHSINIFSEKARFISYSSSECTSHKSKKSCEKESTSVPTFS
ncbi:hypothetical protein AS246_13975 [Enterococcus faecium]|nr:hypothetical protein AS246_13975 [Enterococcus faecium]